MKKVFFILALAATLCAHAQNASSGLHFEMNVDVMGHINLSAVDISRNITNAIFDNRNANSRTSLYGGPGADVELGVAFSDFFLGAGVQYSADFTKNTVGYVSGFRTENVEVSYTHTILPIYAVFKAYIGKDSGLEGITELAIGGFPRTWLSYSWNSTGSIPAGSDTERYNGGFFFRIGTGVAINRFNIGIGYEKRLNNKFNDNMVYLKLGFRIG